MPDIPDVGAIVKQVKARIKQIEVQLGQRERLTDELGRLREALRRLEGEARSRVSDARHGRPPATDRAAGAASAGAAKPASTRARAPRGENKAKVLQALKDGPMTASEIA